MAISNPLPSPSEEYSKESQDILIRAIESYLFDLSNQADGISLGNNTAVSLYSKRNTLLFFNDLGIKEIS